MLTIDLFGNYFGNIQSSSKVEGRLLQRVMPKPPAADDAWFQFCLQVCGVQGRRNSLHLLFLALFPAPPPPKIKVSCLCLLLQSVPGENSVFPSVEKK